MVRTVVALTALCPECHHYFPMKWIKGELKKCSACGKNVKWRTLKKKEFSSMKEAIALAVHLNEKLADVEGSTLRDW